MMITMEKEVETLLRDLANSRARIKMLEDEIKSLRSDLFHADANLGLMTNIVNDFEHLISSDTVYTLLRYGVKSPSSSGVDEYNDDCYHDLYNKSVELRTKLREELK